MTHPMHDGCASGCKYHRLVEEIYAKQSVLVLLRECQAFLFDDSGTPIAPEDLRQRVNDMLNKPVVQELLRAEAAKHPNVINLKGR